MRNEFVINDSIKSKLSDHHIKKLCDREIVLWIKNQIVVKKIVINFNYKNTNLCFYAPVLSKYKLNWFKEYLRNSITFESSIGYKSLITLYRQAGVLVLFVNQSKITILDQELQMNQLTGINDLLFFLAKIGLKAEPKVEIKTIPTNKLFNNETKQVKEN